MKNYLLGMATVIIFGPVFRSVLIKTTEKLQESTAKREAEGAQ